MNILFLADPNTIHDVNWISYFSKSNNCYLISRHLPTHFPKIGFKKKGITYLGSIDDYSTLKIWKNITSAKKIGEIIKNHRIDIFHILYTEPNILWAKYKNKFKIPIIATNRGSDILITINNTFKSKSLLNYFVAKKYKLAFSQCNWITCTSISQKDVIEALNLNKNISLIKTGVNIDLLASLSSNKVRDELKKPYLLFPRNMRSVYNHELALNAISLLPNSIKSTFEFVFIDKNSTDIDYVNKLESHIASIEGVKVHFLPKLELDELVPLYKNASLAVMTNLSDGSPVSAMELMFLKTRLLLSPLKYDNELFGEIIKFKEFTPRSLAKTINSILISKPKINQLERFKNIIIKNGNRSVEMSKLNALYFKLLSIKDA